VLSHRARLALGLPSLIFFAWIASFRFPYEIGVITSTSGWTLSNAEGEVRFERVTFRNAVSISRLRFQGIPREARWVRHLTVRQSQVLPGVAGTYAPRMHGVAIDHWLIALLATLPAIIVFHRILRRRKVDDARPCPICGYDCRATSHRCPECGTTPLLLP
jgi:hypothetical protein